MRRFGPAIGLLAAVAAAYALSLRGDFLWDDDLHVTANPTIIGPLGLKEIWTTARANYFPLVLTNFWVQHAAWGLNPLGYHLVTLAFHIGAALLLWRVLLQLRVPGAWLGAALWALHPVQVESVAWICELKNTQSAVFFLTAILCWLRWLEVARVCDPLVKGGGVFAGRSRTRPAARFATSPYFLALLCAALAILSKPSAVMLPVVLALCAWWLRGRIVWRDVIPLVPFFALSAAAAGWTIWEQKHHSGAIGPEWSQTLLERIAIAGRALWFYLGKLAWPEPLIFIYPRWEIRGDDVMTFAATLAALAGFAVLLWRSRDGRLRPVLFAAAYFAVLLFPVLGFFSVYFFRYSFVGDHFQYLASMGPLALLGAALTRLRPRELTWAAAGIVLALVVLTARQTRAYASNEALWRHTIARNPDAVMAWINLGDTLRRAGRYDESMVNYRHALALKPNDPNAWNDLGNILVMVGRAAEGVTCFERALALRPNAASAHSNLGNALRDVGRSADAIAHFRKALEIDPDFLPAHTNLGVQLAELGKHGEAAVHFEAAFRKNSVEASTRENLVRALHRHGLAMLAVERWREAVAALQRAAELMPEAALVQATLAVALARAARLEESAVVFQTAVRLEPGSAEVHDNYGQVLGALGRRREALEQLEEAARLRRLTPR